MKKIDQIKLDEVFPGFSKYVRLKTLLGNTEFDRIEPESTDLLQKKFVSLCVKMNLNRIVERKGSKEVHFAYDDSGEISIRFKNGKIIFSWRPAKILIDDIAGIICDHFNFS